MEKDFQDRADEYILGRMSDEEKAQFEVEVGQDELKKEQLEFTRDVKEAISSREDKLAKVKMLQRMYDREHKQAAASMLATGTYECCYNMAPQCAEEDCRYDAKKRSLRRVWWWASGIAAALVIGLFVVNPFGSDTSQTPSEIIRGEENDVFDTNIPIVNDTIVNDTIPPRDTLTVVGEKLEKADE